MAKRQMEAVDDIGGSGKFLDVPGTYLFHVVDVKDGKGPKDDKVVNGFTAMLQAVCGEHAGKEVAIIFFDGKMTDKDQGAVARKKQFAFCCATDLVTPADLGKPTSYDPEEARDRFVVATLEKRDAESKYLELAWCNVYHVDDPRAPKHERTDAVLSLIPKQLRHDAAYFEPLKKGKSTNGTAATKPGLSKDQLDTL